MATVNVAELSDSELRKKIKELGKEAGPITKTTRHIWEKRLLKYLAENDEVDAPVVAKKERRKSGGRAAAVSSLTSTTSSSRSSSRTKTPTRNSKKLAMFSSDEEPEEASLRSVQTSPIGFPSPNVVVADKKLSEDLTSIKTVSPKKVNESNINVKRRASSRVVLDSKKSTSTARATSSVAADDLIYQVPKPPKLSEFSDDDFTDLVSKRRSKASSHVVINSHTSTNGLHNDDIDFKQRENVLMKRTSVTVPSSSTPSASPLNSTTRISNITRRNTPDRNKDTSSIDKEIEATLSQVRKSFVSKKPSPLGTARIISNTKKVEPEEEEEETEDEEELEVQFASTFLTFQNILKNKKTLISIISLIILIFAFGIYFYTAGDREMKLGITQDVDTDKPKIKAAKCLFNYLSKKAGDVACGSGNGRKWIKVALLEQKLKSCFTNGAKAKETIDFIKTHFEDSFEFSEDGKEICSRVASKSLGCRISIALSVIVYRLFVVIAVVIIGTTIYFFVKRRWIADDEETRQMLYYVDKILDALKRHHILCQTNKDIPPYLPIPQVRDMLIPCASRKKMAKIWRKAVDFLNSSDSRVRVETQQIAGEDFEVWRWIGVCIPKPSKKQKKESLSSPRHLQQLQSCKSWQGRAFDEINDVVKMPIVPPTPCLKIRYLHEGPEEKEAGWEEQVQNAVLEKCQEAGGDILHVFVDKTSKEGCVYVKCLNIESAGKSFRAMYGNWFDGRLVIVKFVTLARYHQRFPEALAHTAPLRPSNTIDSSMNWNLSS
ncbi:LEM protein 2-like [Clytia hemisphaerica]